MQVKPGDRVGDETVLYKRGCGGALFSLVLQGHVNVWAGAPCRADFKPTRMHMASFNTQQTGRAALALARFRAAAPR